MLKLDKNTKVDFDKYLSDASELGYIFVDSSVLKEKVKQLESLVSTQAYLCKEILRTTTGGIIYNLSSDSIVNYLMNYLGVPRYKFYIRQKGNKVSSKPSLDATKVLKPIKEMGYGVEFITDYLEYKANKTLLSSFNGILRRLVPTDVVDKDNKVLSKCNFTYNPISNFRISTTSENIQGFNKKFTHCFHAPKGYVIVSGDLKQADMRAWYSIIAKDKNNIDKFTSCDDLYESFCRMLLGNRFNLEKFTENRQLYKSCCLGLVYGAKSGASAIETEFYSLANAYLKTIPNYVNFLSRINKKVNESLPITVNTYFGNREIINYEKYNGKYIGENPVTKSLNAPFQSNTSEVIRIVTNYIMDEFAKLGYTSENGSIYSYLNKHDETVFLIKEELLEHSYIFQNSQKIQIGNWLPLEIEFKYYYQYSVEDEYLEEKAKKHYNAEIDLEVCNDYLNESKYSPIKDIYRLNVNTKINKDLGITFVTYFGVETNKVTMELVPSINPDEVEEYVFNRLSSLKDFMAKNDCDILIVCSNLYVRSERLSIKNDYLIDIRGTNPYNDKFKNSILTDFMEYKYLKSKGLLTEEFNNDTIIAEEKFITSVLENGGLFE